MAVRTSETINVSPLHWQTSSPVTLLPQNNLNPDWKEFLIPEAELGTGPNDDIQWVHLNF